MSGQWPCMIAKTLLFFKVVASRHAKSINIFLIKPSRGNLPAKNSTNTLSVVIWRPKISTDAQSVLKDNSKIYIAVLIAQTVQCARLAHIHKHFASKIQKIAQFMKKFAQMCFSDSKNHFTHCATSSGGC